MMKKNAPTEGTKIQRHGYKSTENAFEDHQNACVAMQSAPLDGGRKGVRKGAGVKLY